MKEVYRKLSPEILNILKNAVFHYLDCGVILLS